MMHSKVFDFAFICNHNYIYTNDFEAQSMNFLKLTQNVSVIAKLITGFSVILLLLVFLALQSHTNNRSSIRSINELNAITKTIVNQASTVRTSLFRLVIDIKRISEQSEVGGISALVNSLSEEGLAAISSVDEIAQSLEQENLTDIMEVSDVASISTSIERLVAEADSAANSASSEISTFLELQRNLDIIIGIEKELGTFFEDLFWEVDDDQSLIILNGFYSSFLNGISLIKNLSASTNQEGLESNLKLFDAWKTAHQEKFIPVSAIIVRYPDFRTAVTKLTDLTKEISSLTIGEKNTISSLREALILSKQTIIQRIVTLEKEIDGITKEVNLLTSSASNYSDNLTKNIEEKLRKSQSTLVVATVVSILLAIFVSSFLVYSIKTPISMIIKALAHLDKGDLSQEVTSHSSDEFGQITLGIENVRSNLNSIVSGIVKETSYLSDLVHNSNLSTGNTNEQVGVQTEKIDSVATAMEELTYTVAEIANEADSTKKAAENIASLSSDGYKHMTESMNAINELTEHFSVTSDVIQGMSNSVENIEKILIVIRSIAEQTNLLALNAAIEAARAGEQGRGFAVVADEVRGLANRTQQSTSEIQEYIKDLDEHSKSAVQAINQGKDYSTTTKESIESLGEIVTLLNSKIEELNETGIRISSIANEQSKAANLINEDVRGVSDAAQIVKESMNSLSEGTKNLSDMAVRLRETSSNFIL
ncbi:methyl-accepting chemotaxis protein [Reinekea sp.]|jgi:methyl-accepting chemotaxis protein|uniref:methyl-accepting chemotaxis protein n=1 Tax=Reinekea sp. TaxID=1970455 RepID=UPI002A83E36E|nr:methyl-accepting chemotaxis protein [Reinekea sp.]